MKIAVLDIVGTGGDGIGSVNISTGACVLAAAAGAHVAKHGNRAVSSSCGAADVLEVMSCVFFVAHMLVWTVMWPCFAPLQHMRVFQQATLQC